MTPDIKRHIAAALTLLTEDPPDVIGAIGHLALIVEALPARRQPLVSAADRNRALRRRRAEADVRLVWQYLRGKVFGHKEVAALLRATRRVPAQADSIIARGLAAGFIEPMPGIIKRHRPIHQWRVVVANMKEPTHA